MLKEKKMLIKLGPGIQDKLVLIGPWVADDWSYLEPNRNTMGEIALHVPTDQMFYMNCYPFDGHYHVDVVPPTASMYFEQDYTAPNQTDREYIAHRWRCIHKFAHEEYKTEQEIVSSMADFSFEGSIDKLLTVIIGACRFSGVDVIKVLQNILFTSYDGDVEVENWNRSWWLYEYHSPDVKLNDVHYSPTRAIYELSKILAKEYQEAINEPRD